MREVIVLDLSQVLAGPFAAMVLGDMGCDVIKVEPIGGEAMRHSFGSLASWGETPGFLSVNRNKRSIAIDLKSDAGLAVFHRLAARADVVIQNFRPGVAERLGIGYEQLRPLNEGLIVCAISGFGSSGPYAGRSGYDMIAQAMSGIMSVTGQPGEAPCRCGVPIADIGAGLFAVSGILAALLAREQTGRGSLVETNLLESALAYAVWESTQYWSSGTVPTALGSGHRMNAPYQAYRCLDGYVTIGANNEPTWIRLCGALGHIEWAADPRFQSAEYRIKNKEALASQIEAAIAGMTKAEVEDTLERFKIPAGAVRTFDEVLTEAEKDEHGMVQHAVYGGQPVRYLGSPLIVDGSRIGAGDPPPMLGEHTDEVLAWLGMTPAEIGDVRDRGAFGP
jgi:formyl-CoA transferase